MNNLRITEKGRLALREGWVSLGVNSLLFFIKMWAGIVSGSIAIIADAWHTLSDSFTSIVLLLGLKFSTRPADENHPFGHGRAEVISSLIIGILLSVVGFEFLSGSISKLQNREQATYGLFAIIATITSVAVKEGLAQYALSIYRKTRVTAVKADAWHHRSDALSSVLILIGIFIGRQFWWMDGVLGIFVSLALFYAAYDIIKDSTAALLGEVPDAELMKSLDEISTQVKNGINLHHVHIHRYGNHTELTCHIKLPPDMPLVEAHHYATDIENSIFEKVGIIATIHMEPA